MSNTGKYVRAPAYESEEESINELECGDVFSLGRFVRLNPSNEDFGDVDAQENDPYADYYKTVDPDQETRELRQKVQELEKTIAELSGAKTSDPEHDRNPPSTSAPNCSSLTVPSLVPGTTATVSSCDISAPSIRWDNMKPFPSGVPANKMWETWTKYFENFEIAASLSNAHDPVKRSQLLFLSIGDELQGIIRAAKLRPVTNEPDCYAVFVKNIEDYLKALTDTSAENDMFSSMQQEKGESAVSFHSRLMEKVWLCGYSPADQDRFVRTQLLKGLRNRDLAKAARTYGHDTNFIVQSAARDEALLPESSSVNADDPTSIMAVAQRFSRNVGMKRKHNSDYKRNDGFHQNSARGGKPSLQRSERCSKCNRAAHEGQRCPAVEKP